MDKTVESTKLVVWGRNFFQACSLLTSPTTFRVPFLVKEIACGDDHCMYLTLHGGLYVQGSNSHGALGTDASSNLVVNTPVLVEKLKHRPVVACACGPEHSMAICESGEMFAWGIGEHGVLGLGDTRDQYHPVQVRLATGCRPTSISTGSRHTVVLCDSSSRSLTFVFGLNAQGQLGLGHTSPQLTPTELMTLPDVQQAACGFSHTLFLTRRSLVYATGGNNLGQLGLGHTRGSIVPVRVLGLQNPVGKVAAGSHSAALTLDNDLYVWGTGPFGTWATPTKFNFPSESIRDMDLKSHFGVAMDSSNWLWTWGSNNSGQLGLGDFRLRNKLTKTAVSMDSLAVLRLGGASVLAVSVDSEEFQGKIEVKKNVIVSALSQHSHDSDTQVRWVIPSTDSNQPQDSIVPDRPQGKDDVQTLKLTVAALEQELRSSYRELTSERRKELIRSLNPVKPSIQNWMAEPETAELEEALAQQLALNDDLTRTYTKLQVSHEAQQQELLALAKELETRDQGFEKLRSKYRKLKDAYVKQKVQNQHLLKNFKEEMGYKDRLKEDLKGLEGKLENSIKGHVDLASMQQSASVLQTENKALRKELTNCNREYKALEGKFLTMLQESDSLKTELIRSLDMNRQSQRRDDKKEEGKSEGKSGRWNSELEPIEETESSSPTRSSGKRYTSPLRSSLDFVNFGETMSFAAPLTLFPKETSKEPEETDFSPLGSPQFEEKNRTAPTSLASSFPEKGAVPQPLSLRSSLSEITTKTKELKKSKSDVEMRKVLLERKLKGGRDSETEE